MLHKTFRWGLITAATLATLSAGCQQPKNAQAPKTAPGQLPSLATLTDHTAATPTDSPKINAATYFAHAHLLEKQGNFAQAAAQYEQVLTLQPDFLAARNRLGVTLNKLGRHVEATACFQQCLAAQPNVAFLHNNLGFSLFLEKKYDQADASFRKALELKPDFARARMNLAVNDARRNQFDAAYQEFAKVCSQADALYNVGILLVEAGRYADAAQYLEGALAANPQFEAARRQLNEVARIAAQGDSAPIAATQRPAMLTAVEPPKSNATQASYAGDPTENETITFPASIPVTQVNSTASPAPTAAAPMQPNSTPPTTAAPAQVITTPPGTAAPTPIAPPVPAPTPATPADSGAITYPATIPVIVAPGTTPVAPPADTPAPTPAPVPAGEGVVHQPTIPVIVVPEKPAETPKSGG